MLFEIYQVKAQLYLDFQWQWFERKTLFDIYQVKAHAALFWTDCCNLVIRI